MKRYSLGGALFTALLGLTACGSDDKPFTAKTDSSLKLPDNVRTWANGASALGVYANIYQLIAVADGQQTFADAGCPVVEDDGMTLTMTGGCSEAGGTAWVGSATVERSANGDRTLTLNEFGKKSDATPADTKDGQAHVRRLDDLNQDFDLSLTDSGGVVTTFDYVGHVQGDYDTPTIWNGSGTVSRDGAVAPNGTVDASTTDEVVDNDICSGQPISGNTTLHDAADETVIVTYDGALDCDDKQAASYSLDGESKGKIEGISCSAARAGERRGGAPLALVIAGLAGLLRARRRRAT
jgi:hypothetical protein